MHVLLPGVVTSFGVMKHTLPKWNKHATIFVKVANHISVFSSNLDSSKYNALPSVIPKRLHWYNAEPSKHNSIDRVIG